MNTVNSSLSFYVQAFSVLTDAKQEDERKRATLHKFYEDTEVCLNSMDDKICHLLEQNIPNYKDKIAFHKKNLEKKEYIVLVAGLFKGSTFLRLIMMICSSKHDETIQGAIALE